MRDEIDETVYVYCVIHHLFADMLYVRMLLYVSNFMLFRLLCICT